MLLAICKTYNFILIRKNAIGPLAFAKCTVFFFIRKKCLIGIRKIYNFIRKKCPGQRQQWNSQRTFFLPISANFVYRYSFSLCSFGFKMSHEKIVNDVVDRLFNRLNQIATTPSNNQLTQNSLPTLHNAIQRIIGDLSTLSLMEGELRNRFHLQARSPQTSCSSASTSASYNPSTSYGRPAPSSGRRP